MSSSSLCPTESRRQVQVGGQEDVNAVLVAESQADISVNLSVVGVNEPRESRKANEGGTAGTSSRPDEDEEFFYLPRFVKE